MANVDDGKNRSLKCPFCMKPYTAPRVLTSCLHTFCEKCILSFTSIKSTDSNTQTSTVCPVCKVAYQGPNSVEATSQWIMRLPLNHCIAIKDVSAPSESLLPCEPCSFRGIFAKATKFCTICRESQCKVCADVHMSSRATKGHHLVEVDKPSDLKGRIDGGALFACENHNERAVEYHCLDHDKLVCSTCAVKEHRECNTLKELSLSDKDNSSKQPIRGVKETLKQIATSYELLLTMISTNCDQFANEIEMFKNSLKSTRAKVNQAFDTYEASCEAKLSKAKQSQTDKIKVWKAEIDKQNAAAESSVAMLDDVYKQGSTLNSYLVRRYIERQIKHQEQTLDRLASVQPGYKIIHTFHTKLISLSENKINIGNFEIKPKVSNTTGQSLIKIAASRAHENSSDTC